jgi:hypothetical protein
LPLEQLYKAIGRVYPLSRRLLALVVLFILSFGAFVVLADSEAQAKEHDGSSPQNPQQPPPIKTVGAVEETAATGRSPTESTPVKPLPSSEETQVTPPAGPAPPTVPPPATIPQPEPAPPPGPPYHYEPTIPTEATPQPKRTPTPQPKPGLKKPTLHYESYYEPGMLVDFDPPTEISADPALIVYYHNSSAPKTTGLVSETSLTAPTTGGAEETSVQAKATPPSVGPGVAPVTAAPELPATLEEYSPAENISPHAQLPATPANVRPAPVSASSPTNVAPANVAPAKQQPSLTATYQKVPASITQSAPSYPRSADAMTLREASSSKGVVNSYVAGTAKTFKGAAVSNPRAPLTGVSSAAERPPADDSAQSYSTGGNTASVVPSSPLTSPESSHFYQQFGGASVGASVSSGVGFAPLLLGLLISVMLLCRRDGRSWQLSWYLPKPTSVLLLPLERPG